MFVSEARSLPKSGAPERSFTQVGSGLICQHKTRLEKLARDKPSGLLLIFINYGRKKFYNIRPRYEKTLVAHFKSNLLLNIQMYNMSSLQ
jgi:hypothetical protein